MGRRAWWTTAHGFAESQTRLKYLSTQVEKAIAVGHDPMGMMVLCREVIHPLRAQECAHTEKRPCEASEQVAACKVGEEPREKANLPALWSWTSASDSQGKGNPLCSSQSEVSTAA